MPGVMSAACCCGFGPHYGSFLFSLSTTLSLVLLVVSSGKGSFSFLLLGFPLYAAYT